MFDFLEEEFDERVLSYHQVQGQSRDVLNFPQNPEATWAVDTSAVSRWQRELSANEVALFKQLAGLLLVETGTSRTAGGDAGNGFG